MFGEYDYTFHYSDGVILVETERKGGLLNYRRVCDGHTYERKVVSEEGGFVINPVEPVNLPKEITHYLQIEFSPLLIEPGATQKIYLKFPVEVGVFLKAKKDIEVMDIFCASHQKYTLYGPATGGVVARWCYSEVYSEMPPVVPLQEGVMELTLRNTLKEWIEVAYAVFDSYDMKIYYNEIVTMAATMKIVSKNMAETDFVDAPLRPGLKKSIELYTARGIPAIAKGYIMEWGFS